MKALKTLEVQREIAKIEPASNFLVNVIVCHHRNPTRKLRGLLALLKAGHCVSIGREIDLLTIDGVRHGWELLESPNLIINGTWR